MNIEKLFEVLFPLIILAFFLLQGLLRRPDPIDSFEPPPPTPQPRPQPTPQSRPAPASAGPAGYDEVKSRPQRLDTSSYRRSRDSGSRSQGADNQGPQSLEQLKIQAAKLNKAETQLSRGENRKKRPSLELEEAHSTRKAFEKLSPEQIRQSAREIFYLKELLDKPLSLRPPDQSI